MASVVATGSTKGLGLGLVRALNALGANLVVPGRNATEVERVANDVGGFGRACDVTKYEDVQALCDAARERFGPIFPE